MPLGPQGVERTAEELLSAGWESGLAEVEVQDFAGEKKRHPNPEDEQDLDQLRLFSESKSIQLIFIKCRLRGTQCVGVDIVGRCISPNLHLPKAYSLV